MHPVDIAANGESTTVDLTVPENEEVNAETLVLDAEVAGEAAKGSETRTSPGILWLAIEDTTPEARLGEVGRSHLRGHGRDRRHDGRPRPEPGRELRTHGL